MGCWNNVRRADLTGLPVYMLHNGERIYQTSLGGFCTILMTMIMIAYTGTLVTTILSSPSLS